MGVLQVTNGAAEAMLVSVTERLNQRKRQKLTAITTKPVPKVPPTTSEGKVGKGSGQRPKRGRGRKRKGSNAGSNNTTTNPRVPTGPTASANPTPPPDVHC